MRKILLLFAFINVFFMPVSLAMASPCSDAADKMIDSLKDDLESYADQIIILSTIQDTRAATVVVAPGTDGSPQVFNVVKIENNLNTVQQKELDTLIAATQSESLAFNVKNDGNGVTKVFSFGHAKAISGLKLTKLLNLYVN